jgi:hypothetical protein
MRLEDIVVSLDLAKELKESGYPVSEQDSLFVWEYRGKLPNGKDCYTLEYNPSFILEGSVAAPTSSEIRQYMPEGYDVIKTKTGYEGAHFTETEMLQVGAWCEQRDADAYAHLWIFLKQNNLLLPSPQENK